MEPNTMSYDLTDTAGDAEIGGKAEGLRRLAAAGLPVPPGAVIPARIADEDLDGVAGELASRFADELLAVRSSGTGEDSDQVSFAGQFDTVLNVPATQDAILDAVRQVRVSATRSTVSTYAGTSIDMAVLVMPMIAADSAGVAFTRDPVTGERIVVVEAVKGLGDKLASGEAVGERWRVGDRSQLSNPLGVLSPDEAGAVADLAQRCEEKLGTPQDIEWAIAGGEVVLLQSRPITTVDDVDPIGIDDEIPPGPWEWDSTHNRLPMTPLTISSFAPGFARASRRLAETYGAPISHLRMRTIRGYLYIQVVPPMGSPGQPAPPKPIMRALFKVVPLLRQRRKAAKRAWDERVDRQLLSEWRDAAWPATEAILDRWYDLDPSDLTNEELATVLVEAAELQRETFSWNMNTDPAYLFPLADLHHFVEWELGGGMETTTRLLAGASPSAYQASAMEVSAALPEDVRNAIAGGGGISQLDPASAEIYARHLRCHGQRIIGFDLSNRTHLEDPDRELARIATMPTPRDPSVEAAELATALRATLDAERAAHFNSLLDDAKDVYPIREEGEAAHARVMGCVRVFALEAGSRIVGAGHLGKRDHVVFLTLDEVTGWLTSPHDVTDVVALRRGQHLWAKGQSPAPYLGPESVMPPLEIFPSEVQRIMRVIQLIQTHDARPAEINDGADGVAASPGVYTGPVRLVEGPDEFDKVQPGDVLVAPLTMSPWEVLFPHVGAIVTEGGGLLSHPAIVAREYALPAVVGCEGAMKRFHDGQIVRVDGAAGTVTPIEET